MLTYVELVFYGACSFACRKKRPLILVIRGQGWLFWLCYWYCFIVFNYYKKEREFCTVSNAPQKKILRVLFNIFTKLYILYTKILAVKKQGFLNLQLKLLNW